MSGFEQVLKTWRAAAVPLNPPASEADLRLLAAFLGDAVPPDLRALYSVANGMVDYEMDDWYVFFWSIDRITRERDVQVDGARRWIAFADVLLYSWCFRFSPDGDRTRVRVDSTGEEFECLEDFLSRYASDPGSLDLFEAERR